MFGGLSFAKPPALGEWGENYIASFYKRQGYKILSRNYFERKGKRLGEIDVVAVKDRELVFVEVKTRTSNSFGSPAEAVTSWKQRRLARVCKQFLARNQKYADYNYRIDVAELITDLDRNQKYVKIIENAVEDSV